MTGMNKLVLALATAGLLSSGAAQAALVDRGGGLLYDTVLNVTWLQDANYAKTSGYDADGRMNWSQATTWADNLVYHDSVRNVDYSDWRLTTVADTGFLGYTESFGGTDGGYNVQMVGKVGATVVYSELAYMYYNNLGLKSAYSPTGDYQADYGVFGDGTYGGQKDVGLVDNLQSGPYWSRRTYQTVRIGEVTDPSQFAWFFATSTGYQNYHNKDYEMATWAVRNGDVAAVPEPETYALMLAGLGLMAGVARRKQK